MNAAEPWVKSSSQLIFFSSHGLTTTYTRIIFSFMNGFKKAQSKTRGHVKKYLHLGVHLRGWGAQGKLLPKTPNPPTPQPKILDETLHYCTLSPRRVYSFQKKQEGKNTHVPFIIHSSKLFFSLQSLCTTGVLKQHPSNKH